MGRSHSIAHVRCTSPNRVYSGVQVVSLTQRDDAWTDTRKPLSGGWSLYSNERFGTRIEIPRHIFELQDPPPDKGNGRMFVSKGGARLWVYGSFVDKFEDYRPYLINLDQEGGTASPTRPAGRAGSSTPA
jgi:hypothetical protein